jgi:TPR repeat protein
LAAQGDARAQALIGTIYFARGDAATAFRLWLPLAERGNAVAQFGVGVLYGRGDGVPQNYPEALRWLRSAAEQGNSSAQQALGFMYEDGTGVPQDHAQAHMWFNLAARSGDDRLRRAATHNLDRVTARMTSEQIAAAQRLAREWAAAHPQASR